jgi:hypothetical protein
LGIGTTDSQSLNHRNGYIFFVCALFTYKIFTPFLISPFLLKIYLDYPYPLLFYWSA